MVFVLETYTVQFCLVVVLYLLSIVLVLVVLIRVAHNARTGYLRRRISPKVLACAIFALMLPILAVSGSLSLFIVAQRAPCRSDYSTNTDAPLASSVLVITNVYGRQPAELAVIHARDGATERISLTSAVPTAQSATTIYLVGMSTTNSSPSSSYAFQDTMYSLRISQESTTASAEKDLSITRADIHTRVIQWKRDFRISWYRDPTPVQFSRFGTHLYLHGGPTLFALDATNGATRWQSKVGYSDGANTIEAGNVVYAPGSGDNGRAALYMLNTQHGDQIWQCNNFGFGAQFSALALYHGVLFASSRKIFPHYSDTMPQFSEPAFAVFALNAEDGSVYWRNASTDG